MPKQRAGTWLSLVKCLLYRHEDQSLEAPPTPNPKQEKVRHWRKQRKPSLNSEPKFSGRPCIKELIKILDNF